MSGGVWWSNRILDMLNLLQSLLAKVRLSAEFHEDIRWWHSFLHYFNGKCNFLRQSPTTDVQTDACLVAAGAYFRGDWLYHNFALDTPDLALLHINYKEVLAQVFAVFRWAPCWANQHVIIHSDNEAAVHIINKGTTSHPLIMGYLRQLFWLSAVYNFRFTASYIPGKQNLIADAVSRLHQPLKCLELYEQLCSQTPRPVMDGIALSNHMSSNSQGHLCCRLPGSWAGQTIAERNLPLQIKHLSAFLTLSAFCTKNLICPIP